MLLSSTQLSQSSQSLLFSILLIGLLSSCNGNETGKLIITGVIDGPLSGGLPKAVELYALQDITDLSLYGIGSANNGGGTDNQEFSLYGSVLAGNFIYVSKEDDGFTSFFGFIPHFTHSNAVNVNGDDAIELFYDGNVIDIFGYIDIDGTGQTWEYLDGWVYRIDCSGPDGDTFEETNWIYSGINALDSETSNSDADNPFPLQTYSCSDDEVEQTSTVTPDADTTTTNTIAPSEEPTAEPLVV